MDWRVLGSHQVSEWHDALARIKVHRPAFHDVYFTPEYHRAYEGDGVQACLFTAESGDFILVHPFMMRRIERVGAVELSESVYDIESVYGYSGPLATSSELLDEAWRLYDGWCSEQNIIAEFTRFHPFFDNQQFVRSPMWVVFDRETVEMGLPESIEALWEGYPKVQRNLVRKAEKAGLSCRMMPVEEGIRTFQAIYHQTMTHLDADEFYFFSDDYFKILVNGMGENLKIFVTETAAGIPVAASLFLLSKPYMHYHLSGSLPDQRANSPNNLLMHTAAVWGVENGFRRFHVGGGRTPDAGDSLLRFKSNMSHKRLRFSFGTWVHRTHDYERLCQLWLEQKQIQERPAYFLMYRLPV